MLRAKSVVYVHKAEQIPTVEHWALIETSSVHVEAVGVWAPATDTRRTTSTPSPTRRTPTRRSSSRPTRRPSRTAAATAGEPCGRYTSSRSSPRPPSPSRTRSKFRALYKGVPCTSGSSSRPRRSAPEPASSSTRRSRSPCSGSPTTTPTSCWTWSCGTSTTPSSSAGRVTPGPARLVVYSCYNLSLALHDPPMWMIHEMRRLLAPQY